MTPERRKFLLVNWVIASAIALFGVVPASLIWGNGSVPILALAFVLAATAVFNLVRLLRMDVPSETDTVSGKPRTKPPSAIARMLQI